MKPPLYGVPINNLYKTHVIDEKPEGFIMYKHEPVYTVYTITSIMSGFMCYKSEGNFG